MSDGREEREEQRARLEEDRLRRDGQQEPIDWEREREDS